MAEQRILFVDDELHLLEGLRRSLRRQRQVWEMHFVASGAEALALADQTPFDAIVSDIRMPGMDGAQLLEEMARRHPETVRLVLSGQSEEPVVLRAAKVAHQYLSKPCDVNQLRETLERIFALRTLLREPALQRIISGMRALPSPPETYLALTERLQDPHASVREAGEVVGRDPAMTAKLLQLVNSAFFGLRQRVTSAGDAAALLGLDTLKSLVLTVGVFGRSDQAALTTAGFDLDALWHHSLATARLAGAIAAAERAPRQVRDEAITAGLLHDLGKLILVTTLPQAWQQFRGTDCCSDREGCSAEERIFGAHHGAVGAYLLGLWALPDTVVEAVAFHHHPGDLPHHALRPLTLVHVADALVRREAPAADYLEPLGLAARLEDWRALAAEAMGEETASA